MLGWRKNAQSARGRVAASVTGLQLMSAAVHLDAAWSEAGLDSRPHGDEFRSIPRNDARRPMGSAHPDAVCCHRSASQGMHCSKIVEQLQGRSALDTQRRR